MLGAALALAAGAAAATGHGLIFAAILVALGVCAGAIVAYLRDPVRTLIWLWILVLVNAPLTTLAGGDSAAGRQVSQSDEFFVLLLVVLTVWRTMQTNTSVPLRVLLPALGVGLCGIAGAVINHVPLSIAGPGAWLGLKLWIMIAVAFVLPWQPGDLTRVYKAVTRVGVVVAGFGFIDFLSGGVVAHSLHLVAFTPPPGAPRSSSISSIFGGPNGYSLFMSILFALTFTRYAAKRERSDLILALAFTLSVLLTLRLKGFLSIAVVVMMITLAQRWVYGRSAIAVAVAGVLFVGGAFALESKVVANQVSLYTSSESTARAQLYLTSAKIAGDDFPFGTGFGRFASYQSRLNYSPVYDQYGLSSVYGLSRRDPQFIDDTAWPSVLGETGYAGLAIYLTGLLLLAVALIRRIRSVPVAIRWLPLAALCTLAVLMTDSLGDPTLFDWVPAISFALILGPAMALTRRGAHPD